MGKLSYNLIDLGFFSALGTSEHPGMMSEEVYVKRGTANTYDSNNGVMVVYDEEGRPWILQYSLVTDKVMEKLRREYSLKHGAYVPHSNDGGHFVHEALPEL